MCATTCSRASDASAVWRRNSVWARPRCTRTRSTRSCSGLRRSIRPRRPSLRPSSRRRVTARWRRRCRSAVPTLQAMLALLDQSPELALTELRTRTAGATVAAPIRTVPIAAPSRRSGTRAPMTIRALSPRGDSQDLPAGLDHGSTDVVAPGDRPVVRGRCEKGTAERHLAVSPGDSHAIEDAGDAATRVVRGTGRRVQAGAAGLRADDALCGLPAVAGRPAVQFLRGSPERAARLGANQSAAA